MTSLIKYYIFIFLMMLLSCASSMAMDLNAVVSNTPVHSDTSSGIIVRSFSSQKLQEYRHSSDFQYERSTGEILGWWDRLKRWFWQKINQLLHAGTDTYLGRVIVILAVIGVVIYAAIKLSGIDQKGLLSKKNAATSSVYVTEKDIHSVDFDQVISKAVQENNYRLAIRLWYLKTLKKLADKEVISWKPGKTNFEYITELAGTDYVNDFTRLTRDFEYCWYGEMQVASTEYEKLNNHFSTFNQQLS